MLSSGLTSIKEDGKGCLTRRPFLPQAHKLIRVMFSMLVHQKRFEEGGK
jgi:hypothetical protein